ncbi:MAG TPA: YfhO family protein [bacterium]|nr:YfhO family protein [bacterium]
MKPHENDVFSRPALYPLTLLLLIVPLFIPFLRGRLGFISYPTPDEFYSQWHPYLVFASAAWKSGQPPLWSHNLLGGFPLAAFPHAAVFYPPLILFMMFKFMAAFPLFVILHMACRTLFAYALLREWPCSRSASWLGAAMFALSGISGQSVQYLEIFTGTTWVPGLFWLGLRLARRARAQDFAALALVSAMACLAGDLEILLYSWIVLAAIIILIERAPLKRSALVLGALVLGLMACSAPLLLTLNYLHHSFREGANFNPALTQWNGALFGLVPWSVYSLPGRRLPPHLLYTGALIAAGFLAAVRVREQRRALMVTLAVLAAATLYTINLWPLGYLFNALPVLRLSALDMRFRCMLPVFFLVLAVAAKGFDRMASGLDPTLQRMLAALAALLILLQGALLFLDVLAAATPSSISLMRLAFLVALAAAAIFLIRNSRAGRSLAVRPAILAAFLFLDLGAIAYLGVPQTDPAVLRRPVDHPLLDQDHDTGRIHLASYAVSSPDLWRMFRLDRGPGFVCGFIRNGLARHTELLHVALEKTTGFFDPEFIRERTTPWLDYMAVHYVVSYGVSLWNSEPLIVDSPLLKSAYTLRGNYLAPRPPSAGQAYRLEPGSEWAVTLDTGLLQGDELAMHIAPREARNCITISAGSPPAGTAAWKDAAPAPGLSGAEVLALPPARPGDNLIAITVSPQCPGPAIISAPRVIGAMRRLRMIEQDEKYQLYENLDSQGRYGIYTAVTVAPDDEAKKIILDPARFDPGSRLLLGPRSTPPGMAGQAPRRRRPGDVKTVLYGPGQVVLETAPPVPAFLSIAESYYPGWRAEVDGRPVPIIRANYAYQAVPLTQPGPHRIVLKFLPAEFKIGIWASLATALLFLAGALLVLARPRTGG